MRSPKSLVALAALAWMLSLAVHAQQTNPLLGAWRLDDSKSRYEPAPARRSSMPTVWTFASTPEGIQLNVTANGETHTSSTFKLDGKPYPMRGGSAIDAHALTPVSRLKTKSDLMRAGQIVGHATIVVSKDLKTMTVENRYETPAGHPVHNVMVFDRQ